MNRYMFLYIGPAVTTADSSSPLTYAALQEWEQSIGNALAGRGMLFGQNGKGVVDTGGVEQAPFPMYGFSVVQTDGMEAAVALAKNHPLLSAGREGYYEVQIVELFTDELPTEALAPVPDLPAELQNVQSTASVPTATPQANAQQFTPPTVIDQGQSLPTPVPGELTVPHNNPDDEPQG